MFQLNCSDCSLLHWGCWLSGGGMLSWPITFVFLCQDLSIWNCNTLSVSWCSYLVLSLVVGALFFGFCRLFWILSKCGGYRVPYRECYKVCGSVNVTEGWRWTRRKGWQGSRKELGGPGSAPRGRVARESKLVHFKDKETMGKANSKVLVHFANVHY